MRKSNLINNFNIWRKMAIKTNVYGDKMKSILYTNIIHFSFENNEHWR